MVPDDATGVTRGRPGRPPVFLPNDFEPMLPEQWPVARSGSLQPEKRLMLAALTDAIDLFLQRPAPGNTRRAILQRTTADWIRSNDRHWLFSFVNICETLGLEPYRLRERLERIHAGTTGRAATESPRESAPRSGRPHRQRSPSP